MGLTTVEAMEVVENLGISSRGVPVMTGGLGISSHGVPVIPEGLGISSHGVPAMTENLGMANRGVTVASRTSDDARGIALYSTVASLLCLAISGISTLAGRLPSSHSMLSMVLPSRRLSMLSMVLPSRRLSMLSTLSMVLPTPQLSMPSTPSMVLLSLFFVASTVALGAQPSGPMSVPPPGLAATRQIPILRDVGIDQKLDEQVPLDLEFVDEAGRPVRLGDYFGTRPVVLALVYYECPMLCTQVLNGLVGSLETLTFNPGQDFEVVVVSFDPGETPALAADKKQTYLRRYSRRGSEAGWHFLTGREASIKALTSAVGFRYAYDEAIDQYAHPAAMTVLTADGRVSKYLYGIEFAPRDLRLALVEAGEGRIGTAVDQALLFCYHYDPETGTYGLVVMNLVRTGGVLTLVGLAAFILLSLRRERRAAPHANG